MKKLIIGSLLAITMTISASAEFLDYKKEIGIGLSVVSFEDYLDSGSGLHINGKLMSKLNDNIALGLQLGYYQVNTKSLENGFEWNLAMVEILPTVTFIINDKLDASAMIGYSSGAFKAVDGDNNIDYNGMSYGLGLSYALTKNIILNAEFLYTDAEPEDELEMSTTRTTVSVGYKF